MARRWATLLLLVAAMPALPAIAPARASTGPVDEAVDLSFPDAGHGWVLGAQCTAECVHSVVRATSDGGVTWHSVAAPSATMSRIYFADAHNGWLFGPDLYATHDGGRHWHEIPMPGQVLGLTSDGEEAALLVATRCRPRPCHPVLYRSPTFANRWSRAPVQPGVVMGAFVQMTARGRSLWMLSSYSDFPSGGFRASLTEILGQNVIHLIPPCKGDAAMFDRLDTPDNIHLWVVCGGQPSAGGERISLYRSDNAGLRWRLVTANTQPGRFVYSGYVHGFAVTGARTAWLSLDRGTLYMTRDGGRTWRAALPPQKANPLDSNLGPVLFPDARHGRVLSWESAVLVTNDGGRHWIRRSAG